MQRDYVKARPSLRRTFRIVITAGRFMPRATIVARPVGVHPINRPPRDQRKWSAHRFCRGLNKAESTCDTGSRKWVRAAFLKEQVTHASARLSAVVVPPALRGSTWSM